MKLLNVISLLIGVRSKVGWGDGFPLVTIAIPLSQKINIILGGCQNILFRSDYALQCFASMHCDFKKKSSRTFTSAACTVESRIKNQTVCIAML